MIISVGQSPRILFLFREEASKTKSEKLLLAAE
jgi:hypothetical protein